VVLTTDQKGAIAELEIARRAAELGIGVWHAYTVERYDLIFDLRPQLLRVQCKWVSRYDNVVVVRCYSARRARTGLLRRPYTREDIDAFAAYCAELQMCYLLPRGLFPQREVRLRLGPPKNNQRAGITWAKDFELAARLGQPQGAIAQLGERRTGSAKGTGSSPVGSILSPNLARPRQPEQLGHPDQRVVQIVQPSLPQD
jgi:hypothetical protein